MDNQPSKLDKAFNPKIIKRGVFLFVLVSVVTFTAIFLYNNTGNTLDLWKQISIPYLLLSFVFILNDLLLGGWRNHIFARILKPGISSWVCFKANLANIFMGAVTPGQSGGGLAQMYVLYKNGLKITDIITISFVNWISTLIFFPLSGFVAYYILKDNVDSALVDAVVKYGTSVFTTILIVVGVAMLNPKWIIGVLKKIASIINLIKKSWSDKIYNKLSGLEETLTNYRKSLFTLLKTKPQLMLYSFLMTILLYFNKYALAFVIVLALGFEANFWEVVAIQALVYFLLYFAPSPGGSGIAEVSIASLMAAVLTQDYIPTFTLLYRSFLVFIPALIGSIVVLQIIGKGSKNVEA